MVARTYVLHDDNFVARGSKKFPIFVFDKRFIMLLPHLIILVVSLDIFIGVPAIIIKNLPRLQQLSSRDAADSELNETVVSSGDDEAIVDLRLTRTILPLRI